MTNPSAAVSAEIRAQLARHKRTAGELAAHLGVSEATVYRRLGESSSWSLDELEAAASFFGTDFFSLVRSAVQA